MKSVRRLGKLAEGKDAFGDLDDLEGLDEDQVKEAHEQLVRLRERLGDVEQALARRLQPEPT